MWAILMISVAAHLSVAQFPADDKIFDFPRAVLEAELSSYASSAAASRPCDTNLLVTCQEAFNDDLNIQTNADWHDPAQLFAELGRIYETGIGGVIKICNARIKFFQCLGDTYDSCMNPLNFIQNGFGLENSFAYVRAMQRLQFACGSGFLTGVQNYQCISTIRNITSAATALAICDQNFNSSIHSPSGQICRCSINSIDNCTGSTRIKGFPTTPISPQLGWYICEDIRSAVSNLCPDLKCSLLAPPLKASEQQQDESANPPVPHFDAATLERSYGLGSVQRSILQSLPELTAEQEEAENQKAASMAEEAKRRREGVSDHL